MRWERYRRRNGEAVRPPTAVRLRAVRRALRLEELTPAHDLPVDQVPPVELAQRADIFLVGDPGVGIPSVTTSTLKGLVQSGNGPVDLSQYAGSRVRSRVPAAGARAAAEPM